MARLRRLAQRLLNLFRPARAEPDLARELASHLKLVEDDFKARGLSPDEARLAARRALGGVEQTKELHRDARSFPWLSDLFRDLQYAIRMSRKTPGFTTLAVLLLALGIGGTVAIFSVVDLLMLRALPYRDADRIVTLWQTPRDKPDDREGVAPAAFLEWRERSTVFQTLAAADPFSFRYLGGDEPMNLTGALVTEGFFHALGVEPALGRAFRPEEHRPGRSDVVLLGFGAWQRLFGGDPEIVGRPLILNGRPQLVVGVLPRWFHPDVFRRAREQEIWAPKVVQDFERSIRGSRYWSVVGRLPAGRPTEQARAELAAISAQLGKEYPQAMGRLDGRVVPFREHLAGPIREPVRALFGAVVLVLLIACANVAALLVARGAQRQREFAIRAAIGAGRWRLVRQMLVESLLLAAVGCAAGVAMARVAINAFVAIGPSAVRQLNELALDGRLVVFSVAIAAGAAVLSGAFPALQLIRTATFGGLQSASSGATSTGHKRRFAGFLVVTEVALALVLLVGAALLVRSFVTLAKVDPGFERSNVATLQVFAYGPRYPTDGARKVFFDQVAERMRAVPGVDAVGLVTAMPFSAANINIRGAYRVEGRPSPRPDEQPIVSLTVATADYFSVMRVPLRSGRLFTSDDRGGTPQVAVVNDLLAQRIWPAEEAVGQRISVNWQGQWRTLEVVGVVGRLRHEGLDRDPRPEVFMPFAQLSYGSMTFVVRTAGEPGPLLQAMKRQIWSVDSTLPLYDVATLDTLVSQSLAPRRSMMQLLGALAALAFILAAAGIFGVISFLTTQRTREIGLRIAIGAQAGDIRTMVIGHGMLMVAGGIGLGLITALGVTRVLAAMLYQVSSTDPLAIAAATALLALVALMACYIPARRATRVDPLIALRCE